MKSKIATLPGASGGIGRATAIRLVKDFTGLVLVSRVGKELNKTAEIIKAMGVEILEIPVDLCQVESVGPCN